jgi:hypothetical protein
MRFRSELLELAAHHGFELIRCRRHWIWRHQATGAVVCTSGSPSDFRALRQIERDMRRANPDPVTHATA